MGEPVRSQPIEHEFLSEYERGLRAAVLGAFLGTVLALLARHR
jgi:hypothetical protein